MSKISCLLVLVLFCLYSVAAFSRKFLLKTRNMTKLLEWISVASAVFAVWYSLVGGYVKHPAIDKNMNLILVSPFLFVMLFGLYAVTVILYRVFTFNNCEGAAKELQTEILEAKKDLQSKGLTW